MRIDAVGRADGGPVGAPVRGDGREERRGERNGERRGEWREAGWALPRRAAIGVTAVVLVGFFVIDGAFLWKEHPPVWEGVGAVLGFLAIFVLQLAHSYPAFFPRLARHRTATWTTQALLSYLPMLLVGDAWGGMQAFLGASAVLVFPAAVGWPLLGAITCVTCTVLVEIGSDNATILYSTFDAVLIGLIVIGLSRTSDLIVNLHRSRAELSRLAVAEERLRFTRDLHDVLGFGLSAVALKCELAHRLLAEAPAKAYEELGEVLATSRKALVDVRSVSRGYREMSLSDEADAAVSMLSAAGIRTTLAFEVGRPPAVVDTALAAVLREGLTNLLRHSKAEACEIRAELRAGAAVLTLANDGSARVPGAGAAAGGGAGGLAALDSRVRELGGALAHGPDGRGWFRLEATVPLPDGPERAARPERAAGPEFGAGPEAGARRGPGVDGPLADDAGVFTGAGHGRLTGAGHGRRAARPGRGPGRPELLPRAASAIAFAVLVGYFLAYSVIAMSYLPPLGEAVAIELCMAATLAVQCAVSFQWRFDRLARHGRRLRHGALAVLVLLQGLPWLFFGPIRLGLPGFVGGAALLSLPAAGAWPLIVGVTVAGDIAVHEAGGPPWDCMDEGAYTVMCALVVFGLSRMAQLASELHRSRTEIARLAVTTERLRFARDVHDLLGFSLSAITLKCELVRRIAERHPVRAGVELTEVLGIARQALADVRTVADGRQRMSLCAEAESATAMLAGVGIRATVDTAGCGKLPGDVDTVLATMLREGLTNMLRHSRAAHCEIRAERTPGGVRLTLANDGLHACAVPGLGSPVEGGSGLGNLTTRVEAVNGRLTAGARPDGWFELTAEVELTAV
ncbi:histidine kinase [Streptomyces sp. NPDC006632]|uniref:sensor histidine kinase n=1 Tax=Streptomyces sp. NPDC006632 TaxID=3157182 RepID=UPI0033A33E4D